MRRIIALDFYRFIAAFGVVLLHITEFGNHSRQSGFGYWTSDFGLFVDFFFVLSGFVIGANYSRNVGAARQIFVFLRRRIARIYPLYLMTTLFFLGLFTLGQSSHPQNYTATSTIGQLLLVQQWQINPPLPYNFPAWSISAEWAMYLLFPLLVWISLRTGWWVMVVVALAASLAINYLLSSGAMNQPVWNALRALPTFAIGVFLSNTFLEVRIKNGEIAGFLAFILSVISMLAHLNLWVATSMFCLAIFLTARDAEPGSYFKSEVYEILGNASYSVYLLHAVIFTIIYKGIWPRFFQGPVSLYAGIVISIIVVPISIGSYYFFEVPAREFVSGAKRRSPPNSFLRLFVGLKGRDQ